MTVTQALVLIRGLTGHSDGNTAGETGADTQLGSDPFLILLMDQEIKQLRRRITAEVPELFATTLQVTIANGNQTSSTLSATADYESLLRVQRTDDNGQSWRPIPLVAEPWAEQPSELSWREEGAGIVVFSPLPSAAGTYRLSYRTKQTPDPVVGATVIALPSGFELIAIYRVIAQVRPRVDEDGVTPDQRADKMWMEQLPALKKRNGMHPIPGYRPSERTLAPPGPANFWRP